MIHFRIGNHPAIDNLWVGAKSIAFQLHPSPYLRPHFLLRKTLH